MSWLQSVDVFVNEPADDKEDGEKDNSEDRTGNCPRFSPADNETATDDESSNDEPPIHSHSFTIQIIVLHILQFNT